VPAATAAQVRAALARAAVAPPGAARLATAPLVQSDDDATRAPVSDGRELERLTALVRFEARRAGAWFDRGMALTALLDRRSAACVLAMAGIYERLLARIEHDPAEVLSRRVSLPAHEKAWVAARGMLGART
jgi:phytoene/squalene synthetase